MIKRILMLIIVLAILLIPIKKDLKNGYRTYTTIFYRIVTSSKDVKPEFQFFPKNFKELKIIDNEKESNEIINIYDYANVGTLKENYFKLGEIKGDLICKEIKDIISKAKVIDDRQIMTNSYNYELEFINEGMKRVRIWATDGKANLLQTKIDDNYYFYDVKEDNQERLAKLITENLVELDKPCEFTKTFYVIKTSKNSDLLNIKAFKSENEELVRIPKSLNNFKDETNYEFTFRITKKLNLNSLVNLFENSEILKVKETDKLELDQIQENCGY